MTNRVTPGDASYRTAAREMVAHNEAALTVSCEGRFAL